MPVLCLLFLSLRCNVGAAVLFVIKKRGEMFQAPSAVKIASFKTPCSMSLENLISKNVK
jgi:hypothetical protein